MADGKHTFEVGDEVRGKNSQLIGVVLKILDAGYLMIRESEFDMELNVHSSEVIKTTMDPLNIKHSPVSRKQSPLNLNLNLNHTIDLHWEKLPKHNKNAYPTPIEAQIAWCREQLARALQEGVKEVTIIHGKGSGALHHKVMALLKTYSQIKAVEVIKAALEDAHGVKVRLR